MYKSYQKYKNRKTIVGQITFDSQKEANRYTELKILESKEIITELKLQVPFVLIPSYTLNNKKVREIKYIADFTYKDKSGNFIVEDTKGYKTEVYKLKKKMFEFKYGIEINEI